MHLLIDSSSSVYIKKEAYVVYILFDRQIGFPEGRVVLQTNATGCSMCTSDQLQLDPHQRGIMCIK